MATSDYTDFRIFNDEFYGGMNEVIEQSDRVFNELSRGAVRLVRQSILGHFEEEAFFQSIGSSLVSRRDGTTLTAATHLGMTSDTFKRPKLLRKVGPISQTLDSMKKIGSNRERFSFLLGQQVGKAKSVDYLNTLIKCATTTLQLTTTGGPSGVGTFIDKATAGANTLQHAYMIEALAAFGDASSQIVCWLGHSKGFFDLMGQQADMAFDRVGGATIYEGTVGTLGLPYIMTDSADLINTGGVSATVDSYYTLGLTADALFAIDSEETDMLSDIPLGNENLYMTIQGEHAYNVGVKGYSYTNATENPADAALTTAGNWALKVSDQKSSAGVIIEHA